ncbi:hypothetical protein PG990_006275 [Apiospora arundinis]
MDYRLRPSPGGIVTGGAIPAILAVLPKLLDAYPGRSHDNCLPSLPLDCVPLVYPCGTQFRCVPGYTGNSLISNSWTGRANAAPTLAGGKKVPEWPAYTHDATELPLREFRVRRQHHQLCRGRYLVQCR